MAATIGGRLEHVLSEKALNQLPERFLVPSGVQVCGMVARMDASAAASSTFGSGNTNPLTGALDWGIETEAKTSRDSGIRGPSFECWIIPLVGTSYDTAVLVPQRAELETLQGSLPLHIQGSFG